MSKPNRQSIRLKEYDYSNEGHYFITICSHNRECLFGVIKNDQMVLNELGVIVEKEWHKTPLIRENFSLDEFIIIPNHIHGIIVINFRAIDDVGANGRSPLQRRMQPRSLSSFVAGFKSAITKQINELRGTPGQPVWQRNYFEHVINTEKALDEIREYIVNNPLNWEMDRNNLNLKKERA